MAVLAAHSMAVVSQIAAGQWGLLTTAQAGREGVTRLQLARLTDAGVLDRVDRGVYATTSSPTHHRPVRAAWLALDPTRTAEERLTDPIAAGVVSHTSAAALYRLGDLLDDQPELTFPHRKQSRRGVRLHRAALGERDVTLVDGLPTTTEERTIADLLRDGHDPEHIAHIVGQGVRRGVIDLADLAEHLDPISSRQGQPDGHALVAHLLDLVGLSEAALARELAQSPAGLELIAAGRAGVLANLLAALAPQIDMAGLLGLDKLAGSAFADVNPSELIGLSGVVDTLKPLQAKFADLIFTPQLRATLAGTNHPALYAAIEAAQAPAARAAQQWLTSDAGRQAIRAAAVAASAHPDGSEAGGQ